MRHDHGDQCMEHVLFMDWAKLCLSSSSLLCSWTAGQRGSLEQGEELIAMLNPKAPAVKTVMDITLNCWNPCL